MWEGRRETPYGQRGTASLAYVSYSVAWKLWAQPCLVCAHRSTSFVRHVCDHSARYIHTYIHTCIHWEQEQERKQDRRRVGTWRERELRAPRCGTMRSLSCTRTLLYENQVGRTRSFRTGNGLRGEEDGSVFSVEGDRG